MTTEQISQSIAAARLPRLNEPAPDFEAVTTQGVLRLKDFNGQGLILFSHPADFSPVCTTEFIEENTGVRIPFPVMADLNEEVATDYGMLTPGESEWRWRVHAEAVTGLGH